MHSPLRVAIDLRPLARGPVTGIGLILTQILEELPRRGFAFVGLCDRPVPQTVLPPGVEVLVMEAPGGRILWETLKLPRLLRAIDPPPDLYHATWNHGVPAGLPFPSLLSLHDLIPWRLPDVVPWPRPARLHRWLYRRAVRASARNASAIVTLSEASLGDIAAILPEALPRAEVIPCAVPRWFRPAPSERIAAWRTRFGGKPYWLYFGGFDPRKGVGLLVEAMSRAFPGGVGAPDLVLAGAKNALAEAIAARGARAGLRLHFPGYVPDGELSALLGGANLFLYPSLYEGFGLPPLFAMAAGVPCVVSDGGSLPEVVGDAGIVVPAGIGPALAEVLARAARDPSAVAPCAERGRTRAARYTVEALATRMSRAYERAASRRGESA